MGALYKSNLFKASATAFLVKFKDRIASSFEPATGAAPNLRVSSAVARGVELEVGTLPVQGFSVHASATYIQGYSDNSLPLLANPLAVLGDAGKVAAQFPASGRLFPDAPQSIAALSVQYAKGPVLVNLVGKYNGRRNITVVGEQSLAGFTTFDLNVALPLPSDRWFSSPTLRLDVSNVTNKRFLLPSQHGIAPRLTSITLQSDF
jgi:iron complex outermembrane receptor protein